MLTPAEADAAIAAAIAPVSHELVPLAACAGRILRAALRAERDAPPFDRVAMDGIAFARGAEGRRRFRIAGIQAAGAPVLALASETDCFEVMTGAVMPRGCDTVVPVEQVDTADGHAELQRRAANRYPGATCIGRVPMRGRATSCCRPARGSRRRSLRSPHRRATPNSRFPARRASRSSPPATNSSSRASRSSTTRSGARTRTASLRRFRSRAFAPSANLQLPDREDAIASALRLALERHDVLVLSGGVSAGRFDYVPSGARIARRARGLPRHCAAAGPARCGSAVGAAGTAVFALPGNPVSVLVCLARYVIPALGRTGGPARPGPAPGRPGAGFHLREAPHLFPARHARLRSARSGRWPSRGRPAGQATSSPSPARTGSSSCRPGRRLMPRDSPCRSIAGRP